MRHVIELLKELGDYKDAPNIIRVAQKEFKEFATRELDQAGVPPMFQNIHKNLKASPIDNEVFSSENNEQEKTPKISMGIAKAEKTKKPKTKSGIIAVVVLVLIVVGL